MYFRFFRFFENKILQKDSLGSAIERFRKADPKSISWKNFHLAHNKTYRQDPTSAEFFFENLSKLVFYTQYHSRVLALVRRYKKETKQQKLLNLEKRIKKLSQEFKLDEVRKSLETNKKWHEKWEKKNIRVFSMGKQHTQFLFFSCNFYIFP